ncbi:hypothetical protein MYX65_08415 [Acidobacteria bacterium AH-259-L09]|nr:hypothetical protein [Acidobacteria bacterium AH-259-L09]
MALATDPIIGAEGVSNDVAQEAGIRLPPSVPILQAEVNLPSGCDPGVTSELLISTGFFDLTRKME